MRVKSNFQKSALAESDHLFDRVISILEEARGNVVRAVNVNMVLAYWLIGREIVEEIQSGRERAEYGEKVVEKLSARLTERYVKGFSSPVLWNFRQFYLVYADRAKILSPLGRESSGSRKLFPAGREFISRPLPSPAGAESASAGIPCPTGTELPAGFSPQLSWSHYRALMRVV